MVIAPQLIKHGLRLGILQQQIAGIEAEAAVALGIFAVKGEFRVPLFVRYGADVQNAPARILFRAIVQAGVDGAGGRRAVQIRL